MRSYTERTKIDFRLLDLEDRFEAIERLGSELFGAIAITIPVLPVPLIATVFLRHPHMAMSELEIKAHAHALINDPSSAGRTSISPGQTTRNHNGALDADTAALGAGNGRSLPSERYRTQYAALLRQLDSPLPAQAVTVLCADATQES